MGRPKKKTGFLANIPDDYKTYAFAMLFLFLGAITFMGDTQSILGFYLFENLSKAFGEYYIWIFSPVLITLGLSLFKEKDLHFNSYRAFGLLFFYIAVTTMIGWYDTGYSAVFNLYPTLENVLGRMPLLFTTFLLLFISIYILFRVSIIHVAMNLSNGLPSFADLKESYAAEKKLTKAKQISKPFGCQAEVRFVAILAMQSSCCVCNEQ